MADLTDDELDRLVSTLRQAGNWHCDKAAATITALRARIAELEAFKREVSDAVEEVLAAKASQLKLRRFILPKPVDPLVEAIHEAWPGAAERFGNTVVGETAERLRKALASRGLKLVEAGDAD